MATTCNSIIKTCTAYILLQCYFTKLKIMLYVTILYQCTFWNNNNTHFKNQWSLFELNYELNLFELYETRSKQYESLDRAIWIKAYINSRSKQSFFLNFWSTQNGIKLGRRGHEIGIIPPNCTCCEVNSTISILTKRICHVGQYWRFFVLRINQSNLS